VTLKGQNFSPPSILGVSQPPTSITSVQFRDVRPYGEAQSQAAWLVRYESVPVKAPEGAALARPNLYLAFGANGHLLCAFTEPAPRWAESKREPGEIEEVMAQRWVVTPARYDALQSTLTDVLSELWKNCGADPTKVGQIAIRPRFVVDKSNRLDAQQNTLPPHPPENMWIIEVLGKFVQERHGVPLTTQIVLLRDRNLEFAGGAVLP
jgi:hypothetical protein